MFGQDKINIARRRYFLEAIFAKFGSRFLKSDFV